MKRLFFVIAAVAAFASCVNENGLDAPEARVVQLVAVDPVSKTTLGEQNSILWESGDEVRLVFRSADDVYAGDFKTEFDGPSSLTAKFKGILDSEVTEANGYADGFAIYPVDAVNEDGEVSFTVPVEQRPLETGSFAPKTNITSSFVDLSDLVENGKTEVHFRNALTLMKLNLPADVASVKITSSAPLAGPAALKLSDESGKEDCLVFADDVAVSPENNTVTLLPPAGKQVFESGVLYNVLIWPGTHTLTFVLTDADGCTDTKIVQNKTMVASMAYTFNVSEKFVKEFALSVQGLDDGKEAALVFPAAEQGADPLYNETLTVTDGKISGSLPSSVAHSDSELTGYVVYPASYAVSDTYQLPADQVAGTEYALLSGSVTSTALADEDAANDLVTMTDHLSTINMTLPANVVSVKVSVADGTPLAGTAAFAKGGAGLTPDGEVRSVTLTASEGVLPTAASVTVFKNSHDSFTFTLTDADGCTATVNTALTEGAADLSDAVFTKEVTLDADGLTEDDEVTLMFAAVTDGLAKYTDAEVTETEDEMAFALPHANYVSAAKGVAVYGGLDQIGEWQNAGSEAPVLMYAPLAMADIKAGTQTAAVFTDHLATLALNLPADVREVIVEAAGDEQYLAGSVTVDVTAEGALSAVLGDDKIKTVTITGDAFASYDLKLLPGTYDLHITLTDIHGCKSESEHNVTLTSGITNTPVLGGSFIRTFTLLDSRIPDDAQVAVVFAKDGTDPTVLPLTKADGEITGKISDQINVANGYSAYVVYPASAVSDEGVITYALASDQTSASGYDLRLASVSLAQIEEGQDETLSFQDGLAAMEIKLPAEVKAIKVVTDEPAVGTAPLTVSGGVVSVDRANWTENRATELIYTLASASAAGESCTLTVFPGTYSGTVTLTNSAGLTVEETFASEELAAGATRTLDLSAKTFITPVVLNPVATASHVYTNGTLTGSKATLDLGVSAEEVAQLTSLSVTVKNGDVEYKTYNGVPGSVQSVILSDGKVYLPSSIGNYTVTCNYNDGLGDRVASCSMTVSRPENLAYTLNVTADKPGYATVVDASVNISDAVLTEIPLTDIYCKLRSGASYPYSYNDLYGGSGTSQSSVIMSNKDVSVTGDITYTILSYLKFDGGDYMYASANNTTITVQKGLEIGDYYYADGTTGSSYNSNAVGVVFYVGDPHVVDNTIPAGYTKGLVVGLNEISDISYDSGPSLGLGTGFAPDYYYSISTTNSSVFGNTTTASALIAVSDAYSMTQMHKSKSSSLYTSYGISSMTSCGSGWYIPSCKEYSLMYDQMSKLNSKTGFVQLQSWGASDKTSAWKNSLNGSPSFGYHTVWQANYDSGWRSINYYYLSDSGEEGIYPSVIRGTNTDTGFPHIGRVIFAF